MSAEAAIRLNPFSFMLDPQAVLSGVESSEALKALRTLVVRKLDRSPLAVPGDVLAFDAAIDNGKSADAALVLAAKRERSRINLDDGRYLRMLEAVPA